MALYRKHYTTTKANKELLEAINESISEVIGEPWGIVRDAVDADISYLPIPDPDKGFINAETETEFTQEQLLAGADLTNVTVMDFDISWLPEEP
jgi:hypothetical protein